MTAALTSNSMKPLAAKKPKPRCCVIIPVYNHWQCLDHTVDTLRQFNLPVLLIDDGSDRHCKDVMQTVASHYFDVTIVQRQYNGGKGAAVKSGLLQAQAMGYSHAIQVDADGQHNLQDIPRFIAALSAQPETLIAGVPSYDDSVPKHRLYGRYATHLWIWINTLSTSIRDSMCGFRAYPVEKSCALIETEAMGDRMDFDSEFMVRWHWRGHSIQQLETAVVYAEDGISHFRLWEDNKRITWMHTRLFFGMLRRIPKLIRQRRQQAALLVSEPVDT